MWVFFFFVLRLNLGELVGYTRRHWRLDIKWFCWVLSMVSRINEVLAMAMVGVLYYVKVGESMFDVFWVARQCTLCLALVAINATLDHCLVACEFGCSHVIWNTIWQILGASWDFKLCLVNFGVSWNLDIVWWILVSSYDLGHRLACLCLYKPNLVRLSANWSGLYH